MKPEKKKALFVAILTSAILIIVFTVTSDVVRAEDGISATASTSVEVRVDPLTGPRPTTTRERFEDRRENMEERRAANASTSAAIRAKIASSSEERREKIAEAAKVRAKAYMHMVVRRLNAAVERFEKISARIDSRIEKLANAGVDMTRAKELEATAKTKIEVAGAAVADLKAAIDARLSGDNPREVFGEVKNKVGAAIEAIKEAHRALVAVIVEIKAKGGVKADANAASVDTDASVDASVETNP